jgi:thiol:disulfide interchange protein
MRARLVLPFLFLSLGLNAAEYPQMGEDIYDVHADAAADISAALSTAQAENKRVLLKFGANWCVWCHRLNSTLHNNAAVEQALAEDYTVIQVDVNTRNGTKRNAATVTKYGNPTQFGLPVLVVLDAAGEILTTQETGALEKGSAHDPAKIVAFLEHWAPSS